MRGGKLELQKVLERFIPDIRHNVFGSIHKLVTAVLHFDLEYGCESTKEKSTRFTDMSFLEVLTKEDDIDPSWARDIAFLWQDQAIQEAYMRGNEFHLMTNAEHFITSAERILAENYKPTIDDILRMRLITRSSVTKTYELTSIRMTLHDMGGQRPDRNEWIRQLHEPSAIIFLASLSEYNQTVEEASERKNRVQESLDIFNDLLGYSPFENTPVILLLNKSDIFSTKIRTQPLKNFFPDYDGPEGDEITGRDYITTLYEKSSEKHRRNLLVRYTEATNTENFKAIFSFVNNYVSRCVIGIGGLH
ncbi:Guanine nucleotide-binding protein subunit alpha-15 [Halocaridina rubra]|uniref:Guanine nucleotide-binding protein subunit alpha-15 n=1 Tax=Halocaridina rubra TaxID=373956 RepID=A0AAN8WKW8_HALRR